MTAVREPQETTTTGRVVRVTGPVVDVEFARHVMPELHNALHVGVDLGDSREAAALNKELTLEVEQHIGDNIVRTVSMQPTDGLVRGAPVTDTGRPIEVPVGDQVKGHVFNALGRCSTNRTRDTGERWAIHPRRAVRPAGGRTQSGDGHQGHRPWTPRGRGKIGRFGGAEWADRLIRR